MKTTPELLSQVKQIAQDNYETWGQYVIECYTDEELVEDLRDFATVEEWVDVRISVANVMAERSSMCDW